MTAARLPLPHWRTQSRPCRHAGPAPAVYSPAYLAAFARLRTPRDANRCCTSALFAVGIDSCIIDVAVGRADDVPLDVVALPPWPSPVVNCQTTSPLKESSDSAARLRTRPVAAPPPCPGSVPTTAPWGSLSCRVT